MWCKNTVSTGNISCYFLSKSWKRKVLCKYVYSPYNFRVMLLKEGTWSKIFGVDITLYFKNLTSLLRVPREYVYIMASVGVSLIWRFLVRFLLNEQKRWQRPSILQCPIGCNAILRKMSIQEIFQWQLKYFLLCSKTEPYSA